jgi:hypothetical protein
MIQDDDSGWKTDVTAQNIHMTVTSMVHPGGSDAEGFFFGCRVYTA